MKRSGKADKYGGNYGILLFDIGVSGNFFGIEPIIQSSVIKEVKMPIWKCGKCGETVEGRCRPKTCPKCGADKENFEKAE